MIPIHCENLTYSLKVHLRANYPTWHCQVLHVLSFSYISLPVLFDYVQLEYFVLKFFEISRSPFGMVSSMWPIKFVTFNL